MLKLTVSFIILTATFIVAVIFAANPIKLIVNNQEIKSDVPPQIIDGRMLVELRIFPRSWK